MIARIVAVKVLAVLQWIDYSHRVLLDTSPLYQQVCGLIGEYIATGRWGTHRGYHHRGHY